MHVLVALSLSARRGAWVVVHRGCGGLETGSGLHRNAEWMTSDEV